MAKDDIAKQLERMTGNTYSQITSLVRSSDETPDRIQEIIRSCETELHILKENFFSLPTSQQHSYRKYGHIMSCYRRKLETLERSRQLVLV